MSDLATKHVFCFQYGCLVFWGLEPQEQEFFIEFVQVSSCVSGRHRWLPSSPWSHEEAARSHHVGAGLELAAKLSLML